MHLLSKLSVILKRFVSVIFSAEGEHMMATTHIRELGVTLAADLFSKSDQ